MQVVYYYGSETYEAVVSCVCQDREKREENSNVSKFMGLAEDSIQWLTLMSAMSHFRNFIPDLVMTILRLS
jgi:hypothetical protein